MDLLVQRVLPAEGLQFGDEFAMLAQRQPGVDETVSCLQEKVLKPPRMVVEPGQLGEVGQRPAASQLDGGLQPGLALRQVG